MALENKFKSMTGIEGVFLSKPKQIETVKVTTHGSTFIQKLKKHYKDNAKWYNLGVLAVTLVVILFVRKSKKRKNVRFGR